MHVWTDDTLHYPLVAGWRAEDMQPRRFTPEDLFRHCRRRGVARVNLIQMSYYYPRDLGRPGATVDRFDNDYMLDMIGVHPDVFVGTAVIDPLSRAPDEQMRELARRRVRAFRILPRLSRQPPAAWLQSEGYARMFAAGARDNLAMSCLIDPDSLPELDRMCRAYPDTPVIIDHLCRIGADGTIRAADVDALCAMTRHHRVMVKIGAFYCAGPQASAVSRPRVLDRARHRRVWPIALHVGERQPLPGEQRPSLRGQHRVSSNAAGVSVGRGSRLAAAAHGGRVLLQHAVVG